MRTSTISVPTLTARLLAGLAAISLGLAACGSNETVEAGVTSGDEPTEESTPETLPDEAMEDDMESEPTEASAGFTPLTPRTDLVSLEARQPDELIIDPADDSRMLVRFEGASEPCSGAALTVTETDAEVIVLLEVGLDPNAAAMSCIAQVFDYEIAVKLDQPLGDRQLTAAS